VFALKWKFSLHWNISVKPVTNTPIYACETWIFKCTNPTGDTLNVV